MRNKSAVVIGAIGLLTTSGALMLGIALGANTATVSVVRDTPNELCFKDTATDQFSKLHVETKLKACQVVGMTKQAAIDYLEAAAITVRIASEDGEGFALTEDYSDSRVNLDILVGIVVGASAW
ncbi:unannotated protein [freshwater metagenome]|uniref:Unannotated protein n=1 Tax=freshwater metagenome TaxID=449393 RepID=A0A6J6DXJ9_9ZZZZ|nr:hypothetical protein [Actinomycetota bacterium]